MGTAEQVAEEFRLVARTLVRRLRAESGGSGLTWSQGAVLRRLENDGALTTADLARAELITPQTMGALIAELEAQGLVARTDDAKDARRRLVSLTDAGRGSLAEARARRQSWLTQAIEARLTQDEQRSVLTALELLRRVASA